MRAHDVLDSELRLLVAVHAAVAIDGAPAGMRQIDSLLDERWESLAGRAVQQKFEERSVVGRGGLVVPSVNLARFDPPSKQAQRGEPFSTFPSRQVGASLHGYVPDAELNSETEMLQRVDHRHDRAVSLVAGPPETGCAGVRRILCERTPEHPIIITIRMAGQFIHMAQ